MTALDKTAKKVADKLTNKYGKSAILRRTERNEYNEVDGTGAENQIPVEYSVKVTPPQNFMFTNIDGTLIEYGDQVVSLPSLNLKIVPDMDTDTLILDDEEWFLKQVGKMYSGDEVAMYILHLSTR